VQMGRNPVKVVKKKKKIWFNIWKIDCIYIWYYYNIYFNISRRVDLAKLIPEFSKKKIKFNMKIA